MTMTTEEIADQVMRLLKRDGDDAETLEATMGLLLAHCEDQGASRETIKTALNLAAERLRAAAKAKRDHADALEAYFREKAAPV